MALAVLAIHVTYKPWCSIKLKLRRIQEISPPPFSNWPYWCFPLMRGHSINRKGLLISLCAVRPRRQCRYTSGWGEWISVVLLLFRFVLVLSSRIQNTSWISYPTFDVKTLSD